jgi:hypothetical protein
MTKGYNKIKFMGILFVFLFALTGYAQTPTYQAILANDTLVSSTVYEFDIYILRAGTTPFELAGFQIGLNFNRDILISQSWPQSRLIPGTCEYSNSAQVPPIPHIRHNLQNPMAWMLASKAPPGAGNGSIISNVSPGTRVGRFQLTDTVPFMPQSANFTWSFSYLYDNWPTKVYAYVEGWNVEITTPLTHLNNLSNYPLPIELNKFTAGTNGCNVNLNWETKTEINSSIFQIERAKQSSQSWIKVGEIVASGNSNSPKEYSFVDNNLKAGDYSYRLKQIDADGKFEYSKTITAQIFTIDNYALLNNYPNPFNPSTTIEFQIPDRNFVTLKICDMLGTEVATLVNEEKPAGRYELTFDASNLSSGTYFYILRAGDYQAMKKMILVK